MVFFGVKLFIALKIRHVCGIFALSFESRILVEKVRLAFFLLYREYFVFSFTFDGIYLVVYMCACVWHICLNASRNTNAEVIGLSFNAVSFSFLAYFAFTCCPFTPSIDAHKSMKTNKLSPKIALDCCSFQRRSQL